MWLDAANALRPELLEPVEPIGDASLMEGLEPVDLGRIRRNNQFAAHPNRDRVGLAVGQQFTAPGDAKLGFVGAWPVVETGVEHSTVVARLM